MCDLPRGATSLSAMRGPTFFLCCALAACTHSAPGTSESGAPTGPFQVGEPLRLTYSGSQNRAPTWSPRPANIVYAFARGTVTTFNLPKGCAGELPVSGGARVREYCDQSAIRADTGTVVEWPALAPGGRLAMIRQRSKPYDPQPYYTDLAIQGPRVEDTAVRVFLIPYFSAPTSRTHFGIAGLQWLDTRRLLYVAQNVVITRGRTTTAGIEVVVLDPALGAAGVDPVPGTQYASSVSRGATPDTIYYTVMGDTRVYRRALAAGVVDIVVDFGGLGIARDVQVRHGRLVAVVGGNVGTRTDPYDGLLQDDFGGPVYALDLPAGPTTLLTDSLARFRHLALAPDGGHVVAESNGDLWSIAAP